MTQNKMTRFRSTSSSWVLSKASGADCSILAPVQCHRGRKLGLSLSGVSYWTRCALAFWRVGSQVGKIEMRCYGIILLLLVRKSKHSEDRSHVWCCFYHHSRLQASGNGFSLMSSNMCRAQVVQPKNSLTSQRCIFTSSSSHVPMFHHRLWKMMDDAIWLEHGMLRWVNGLHRNWPLTIGTQAMNPMGWEVTR